jgi:hypothetical protein
VAWNPRATFKAADEAWVFTVPIYFVPEGDGLIGGVAPSFDTASDDWSFTLFVGKAFRMGL